MAAETGAEPAVLNSSSRPNGGEMEVCTHTSDWWKEMIPCVCCGAMYSDAEAERISEESEMNYRRFTADQQAIIARHEAESEEL